MARHPSEYAPSVPATARQTESTACEGSGRARRAGSMRKERGVERSASAAACCARGGARGARRQALCAEVVKCRAGEYSGARAERRGEGKNPGRQVCEMRRRQRAVRCAAARRVWAGRQQAACAARAPGKRELTDCHHSGLGLAAWPVAAWLVTICIHREGNPCVVCVCSVCVNP